MSTPNAATQVVLEREEQLAQNQLWCTVVHDDPINTMNYVTWVFVKYFGFSTSVAEAKMLQVHNLGRAVVSRGPQAAMAKDVNAMHGYGLHATMEPLADADAPEDH